MFRSARFFPLRGLALVALGFLLASVFVGVVGSVVSLVGFLILLAIKLAFMFFLFSMLFRFIGGSVGPRGPWGGGRRRGGPWAHHHRRRSQRGDSAQWWYKGEPMDPGPTADVSLDPEQREWEESLRQARREVDDLDSPYSDSPYKDAGTS